MPGAEDFIACLAQKLYVSEIPDRVLHQLLAGEDLDGDGVNEDRYRDIADEIRVSCAEA